MIADRSLLVSWLIVCALFFCIGSAHECYGEDSPAKSSANNFGLPCLAPLLFEARKGTAPLSISEAFFDGPFYRVADPGEIPGYPLFGDGISDPPEIRNLLALGWQQLHAFRPGDASKTFREIVARDPENVFGFLGLALTNLERPRYARTFFNHGKSVAIGTPESSSHWFPAIESLIGASEKNDASWVPTLERIGLKTRDPQLQAWIIRQLILDEAKREIPIQTRLGVHHLLESTRVQAPKLTLPHYEALLWVSQPDAAMAPPFPQPIEMLSVNPARILSEFHFRNGDSEIAISMLHSTVAAELETLKQSGKLPDEGGDLGSNWASLARMLSESGRVEEALTEAKKLSRFPLNKNLIENQLWWKPQDQSCRREGQRALASILINHRRWNQLKSEIESGSLRTLPREKKWFLQSLASMQNGEGFVTTPGSDLEKYASWLRGPEGDVPPSAISGIAPIHLGSQRLLQNRPGEALAILRPLPRSFLRDFLMIQSEQLAGRKKEALFLFTKQFQRELSQADSAFRDNKIWEELTGKAFTAEEKKTDSTQPNLSWEPKKAPSWKLSDAAGNTYSAESLRGKPTVLIFFLGGGCPLCMKQLSTFAPWDSKFEEAGIQIITVSTDAPLPGGREASNINDFPFPILHDESLSVFKQFGVFDEFEKWPMHGTVFLSSQGDILWRDISHEPFLSPTALLEESKRLLSSFD